ncbi:MAG TPA: PIG-L family deacetylase [Thermoanaerobaculia bacterium]|nr:PIG-L family deacetylase [Thermoanaerobaculia bacterium]
MRRGPCEQYGAVYLSPHLDDAVLSCGGQIHRRVTDGEAVLVATVGTADEPPRPWPPLVAKVHRTWGLPSRVAAARRAEDAAACGLLGADWLHLGLPDAIYRRRRDGGALYPTLRSLFAGAAPEDSGFAQVIVAALERRLPPHRQLLAPLGVGGHVDHLLTRQAAELLAAATVSLYEDFPYAAERWRRRNWQHLAGPDRVPGVVPLRAEDLEARLRAALAYTSQLRPLFGTAETLRRRLERHVRRVGGEVLWRQA